jgi:16S rRNA (uracil1498-N3)-methyltransferase
MQARRFYLPPEKCNGNMLHLVEREAHHALHVLRLKPGEEVIVLDGAGGESFCEVENVSRNSVVLRVTRMNSHPPLPCCITLLVGIPKGKIIESIIQKSVELGVHRIIPLLSERVVSRFDGGEAEDKREKWQNVAIEAIKQCGAAWLPKIEAPTAIEELFRRSGASVERRTPQENRSGFLSKAATEFELSLVGSLQKERRHPREIIGNFKRENGRLPKTVAVWIGPEGDFTLEELHTIQSSGAQPISLGNLVLRVETAVIYCLSILNYELSS